MKCKVVFLGWESKNTLKCLKMVCLRFHCYHKMVSILSFELWDERGPSGPINHCCHMQPFLVNLICVISHGKICIEIAIVYFAGVNVQVQGNLCSLHM